MKRKRPKKDKYVIGVDLGGTKILCAIVSKRGKIIHRVLAPTTASKGQKAVISNIKTAIKKLLKDSRIPISKISSIGIGAPGPIEHDKGVIIHPPNLPGWNKVPLKRILQKEFRKKVILDNDANAAALGEYVFGSASGSEIFIYITVSTGIGGGIIINGKLLRGTAGGAGEIGHMIIEADGPRCGCGKHGCLEAMASGTAISRNARELRSFKILKLAGGRKNRINSKIVEAAARSGDKTARNIIKEASNFLGIGLSNLINIFAPDVIALGGGVMKMGDLLFIPAKRKAKALALSPANKHVKIVKAKLKDNIGVLGAAALCLCEE